MRIAVDMGIPRRALLAALMAASSVPAVSAQAPAVYRASPDTLHYTSDNAYLLYFVRGADTLGQPMATTTHESRLVSSAKNGLSVWVRLIGTGEYPFDFAETYLVSATGRLLAVGGQPLSEMPSARVDLLPRLPTPAQALTSGSTWTDTVSIQHQEPYGPIRYAVQRSYKVLRIVDSLGSQIAFIVGTGQMQLRQGGWQDEASRQVWWQEVTGPVADTVAFDISRGRVVSSYAHMDLIGAGGAGPIGTGDTLPSGLRSSVRLTPR